MKKLFKSTPKAPSPAASVALLDDPEPTNLPVFAQHSQAQLQVRQQQAQAQHQRLVANPPPPVSGQLQANWSWQERERESGASSPIAPHAPLAAAHILGQQPSTPSDVTFSATAIASHPPPPAIANRHSVLYGTPNDSWEVLDRQGAPASVRERDRSASVPALTSPSGSSSFAVAGAGTALGLRPGLAQAQSASPNSQNVQQWVHEHRETASLDSQAGQPHASAHPAGSVSNLISSGGSGQFAYAQPQRPHIADRAVPSSSPPVPGQGGSTTHYSNGYSPTSPSHPPQSQSNTVSDTPNAAPAMLRKKTPSNNSNSSGGQSSSGTRAGQILGALDPSMFGSGLGGSGMGSPVAMTNTLSQTQSQIQREREREQLQLQQQQQQQWAYQQQQLEYTQAQQRSSARTNAPQSNSRGKSFLDASIKSSAKSKPTSSKTKERGLGDKLRRNKSTRKNRDSLSDIEFKAKGEEDEEDVYLDDSENEHGSESRTGSVDQHHAQYQHVQMHGYPHPHSHHQNQHGSVPPNADHAELAMAYDAEPGSNHFASPPHHALGSTGGHGNYAPLRRPSAASSSLSSALPPNSHSAQPGPTMPPNERRNSWVSNPAHSPYPPSSGGSGAAIPPSGRRDLPRESADWDREARIRYPERDSDVDGSNVSTLKGVEIASGFALGSLTESKEGREGRSNRGFFDRLKDGVGVDWDSSEHSHRETGPYRPKEREREAGEKPERTEKRDRKEGKEEWWEKIFSKDKDRANEKKSGKKDKGESTFDKLLHPHQQQQRPPSFDNAPNKNTQQQNLPPKERERELRERDKETRAGLTNAGFLPTALGLEKGFDKSELAPRMVGAFVSPSGANMDVNWGIALDLCERTSDPEVARGVAKAIRKELKYARVSEQLGATTLWAIMLQNASPLFITQTCSRKFLDVVEDLITQNRMPLVRERLLEVLGAAVYISGPGASEQDKSIKDKDWAKRDNFRSLWKKVKPDWMPEEGTPLSTDNPMFHPHVTAIEAPVTDARGRNLLSPDTRDRDKSSRKRSGGKRGEEPTTVIIPVDEDMRRLFQECKIGRGNAALLCEALAFATPEDLKRKELIKEFHTKCLASLELINAQIPWATAGAERSRQRELERGASLNPGSNMSASSTPNLSPSPSPSPQPSPDAERNSGIEQITTTKEERLLAELLRANEELSDALRIYSDIDRIGKDVEAERAARERSKAEVRGNASQQLEGEGSGEGSASASSHQMVAPLGVAQPHSLPKSSPPSLPGDLRTSGHIRDDSYTRSVGRAAFPQYASQLAAEPHHVQQTAYSIPSSLQPGNALSANANTVGMHLSNYVPQEQPVPYDSPYQQPQQIHHRAMPVPPTLDHSYHSGAPIPPSHGHTHGHTHSLSQNSIQQQSPAQGHAPALNATNTGTLTGPRQLRGPRSPLPIPGQYTVANRESVVGTPNTPSAPLPSTPNYNQLVNGLQNVYIQPQPGQFGASRTPSPAPQQLSRPSSLVFPHPPSIHSRSHSRAGSLEVPQLEQSRNNSPSVAAFAPTPALSFSHNKLHSASTEDIVENDALPMSDKAAGKRKAVANWNNEDASNQAANPPSPIPHPPNLQHPDMDDTTAPSIEVSVSSSSESDSESENRWTTARRRWKTQYVYDAAAERARERVRQLQMEMHAQQQLRA